MSGSGAGFGGGSAGSQVACDKLVLATFITSPKPEIVALIKVNDILDITTATVGGLTHIVVLLNNEIAGNIISSQMSRLIECIQSGTIYKATVVHIVEGTVRVRVSPVVN